jgi:Fe(3+) dicitrate transport protein
VAKKLILFLICITIFKNSVLSQDSKKLPEVNIHGNKNSVVFQSSNQDFLILEGKKNETILLENVLANKATNNVRQVMAKVPGLNIWETDGNFNPRLEPQ